MEHRRFSLTVSPAIGSVTAEYILPEKSICIMTLAHGAGAGMDHAWMVELAGGLAAVGIATLRFNFPFMEKKKGPADRPPVAHATIAAALDHAHAGFPALSLFASGKSFGGRMTSQLLAEHPRPEVRGIVFYGFPLHPAKKPSIERAEHLKAVKIPMLFFQGTKDALAEWELIEPVVKGLPKGKLVRVEGADHAFKAGKKDVMAILVEATKDWIEG
jgi:predicted alpha/beta-hydrolase family hydrolase